MRLRYGQSGAFRFRDRITTRKWRHRRVMPKRMVTKWRLLLPGASEPRLTLLRRQDFKSVFQTALRGLSNRSIVVVGNYCCGPISAEPYRAKARPLRPRRSCFAPTSTRPASRAQVEAPGTAPGSERFIATAIYRHSRLAPARRI